MQRIKEIVKDNVPGAKKFWRWLYAGYKRRRSKRTKIIFTEIYKKNGWGSAESVSGLGSELRQTSKLLELLPALLAKYQIKTILDIPCGDLNWMQKLDYSVGHYTGADIVPELIALNRKKYGNMGAFKVLNLLKDPLPKVDIILCRDCLVHFSYADIKLAVNNMKKSGSAYLLTTTYPKHDNRNILTGDWRHLNLRKSPFNFPEPIESIVEGSTEIGSKSDKSLALWLLENI